MDTPEKIADTKRQLDNPRISAARKRDLTKYLWRLQREQRNDGKRGSGHSDRDNTGAKEKRASAER